MPTPNPKPFPKIDANPTKRFFISMLVRDIQLIEAIVDLVDNSVDGARKLRPPATTNGSARYHGLAIDLTLGQNEFRIRDNCGGIEAIHAQNYVFNFGRKDDFPTVDGSVGEFGVGMKRALFKLGRHFRIDSRSARSSFVVDIDSDAWEAGQEVPWEFEFEDYRPSLSKEVPEAERYTEIVVDRLHGAVADQFNLGRMRNELAVTIGEQHQASLAAGLGLLVNGDNVIRRRPAVLLSDAIMPIRKKFSIFTEPGGSIVEAEIVAGLSDTGEQASAGWYIYCNDRLVLGADKSSLTGWGRTSEGTLPAYHPQYRRFRGYAFLTSEETGLLPWNTTKTSVDPNSPVYRQLLLAMLPIMQQVVSLIDEADDEMDSFPRGAGPINKAIKGAPAVALSDVPLRDRFEVNVKRQSKKAETVSVQYRVDRLRLDAVKESLALGVAGQVGLATFDYYYESEVE